MAKQTGTKHLRLPNETMARVDRMAALAGVNRSEMAAALLAEVLDNGESEVAGGFAVMIQSQQGTYRYRFSRDCGAQRAYAMALDKFAATVGLPYCITDIHVIRLAERVEEAKVRRRR